MTNQEFISFLKSPELINPEYIDDLKSLSQSYPYFTLAHLLHLRASLQNEDINANKLINRTSIYIKDRRWFYNFVFYKNPSNKNTSVNQHKSGGYFDVVNTIEERGEDVQHSLSELAKRLKSARQQTVENSEIQSGYTEKDSKKELEKSGKNNDYAQKIRFLMQQRKYEEALEILKDLNLNNPKKNVYFADQIRFLEKIIENLKK